MKDTPSLSLHRKVIPATAELIMSSADRQFRIVAKKQRADASMPDEQDVAFIWSREDVFDVSNDPVLSVDGPFPSSVADRRVGEERISSLLKTRALQEARR